MCKYFWEKNYIDQFLIPPCLPLQSKGKTATSIFVFRKVLDCKHLKQIKGGWPVHPTLFPGFQSFQQQPSVCRKEGGPVEYKRDRRCLCLWLRFKARGASNSPPSGQPRVHSFKGQQEGKILGNLRRKASQRHAEGDCHPGQRTKARPQSSPQCLKQWHAGISFKNCSDKRFFSCRKRRDYSLFCLFILVQIKAPWNFGKGQMKSGTVVSISGLLPVVGNTPWSLRADLSQKPNKGINNLDYMPSPAPVSLTALTKWYGMASAPYNIWIVDSLS